MPRESDLAVVMAYITNYTDVRSMFSTLGNVYGAARRAVPQPRTIYDQSRVGMMWLDEHLNEINCADRYWQYNHAPHFAKQVTTIVDTFPVCIRDVQNSGTTYQPKYKECVLKFLVGCTFTGQTVLVAGPWDGGLHADITCYRKFLETPPPPPAWLPFEPWELVLADDAFETGAHCLCGANRRTGADLSDDDKEFNRILSWYRARIEHLFGHWSSRFDILCKPIRTPPNQGGREFARRAVNIVSHLQAMRDRRALRYTPFGPWGHE
jgi:hypothetical protein